MLFARFVYVSIGMLVGVFLQLFLAVPVFGDEQQDGCFIAVEIDAPADVLEDVLRACERGRERMAKYLMAWEDEWGHLQRGIRMTDMAIRMLLPSVTPHNPAADMQAAFTDTDMRVLDRIEHNTTVLRDAASAQGAGDERLRGFLRQAVHYLDNLRNTVAYHRYQKTMLQKEVYRYETAVFMLRRHLFGLRSANSIPFAQALEYAEQAARATGIRTAFLLGLLKNESSFGHNIGNGAYRTAMHPIRDQTIFPVVVGVLGYNPDAVPVSADPGFGWGGAMGSAQFIPSTWVCYGGFVNVRTNTCELVDPLIRSTEILTVGSIGADVKRLQVFLNTHGFVIAEDGPGSPGNETEVYTEAVAQAVVAFQKQYADRILMPHNRTQGAGTVDLVTRNTINQIDFYGGQWRYEAERDSIRRLTRSSTPSDPFNPRDAFFASALYLRNLGAATDECGAARRYYAGSNWKSVAALNYCRAVVSNACVFEREGC